MKDGATGVRRPRIRVLRRGLRLMTSRERAAALGIVGLMMVAGFVESAIVALVLPLVYVIVDPAALERTRIGQMLADVMGGHSLSGMFPWLVGALVALILLSGALNGLANWAVELHSARCRDRLAADLLRRCIAAPYLWLVSHKTAVLSRHLFEDVRTWRREFVHSFIMIIQSAIMIVSPAAVAIALAPSSGLAALVVVGGVCSVVVLLFRRAIRNNAAASKRASDALMQALLQILGGLREIKVSGQSGFFVSRFDRLHADLNRLVVRGRLLGAAPASMINLLGQIGFLATALVLWLSDLPATEITGQLALIGVVVSRVVPAFNRFAAQVSLLFKAAPFVESLINFIDGLDSVTGRERSATLHVPEGWRTVTLDNVTFQYPGAPAASVRGASLVLERGRFYGFVGRSGAGKSTLVNLLLGLVEPTAGRVLVDDVPLGEIAISDWHRRFGYVPQDAFVIDASLRDNVTFGNDIADAAVAEALVQSRLALAAADGASGLDTPLGERGRRLSGGQVQRVALARAFARHPEVMLLDEATSALDSLTEAEILASVEAFRGHTLGLMIAHRVTTLRECDRIFVIEDGAIVESGTYSELLRASQRFRDLAAMGGGSVPGEPAAEGAERSACAKAEPC